ncbi:MAG: 4a-hydroxytetrahydrobiopterin dehydratase [Gammaproteobacteria bacterium]|nr:4a-hydroxytetrahydrobiopterin dehydratase [Gammaproteobacteria bacterium]MCW9060000.1 4a-hydroxytetrahydrobiopterin dehydratase [Gammaproteobacteria bacterium]
MNDLLKQHCQPLEKGTPVLDAAAVAKLLPELDKDWRADVEQGTLVREIRFKNYYQTIAFVNALAWIANQEDHHPDLEVSYNRCTVHFSTHSIGGLSLNDFICAARLDALQPGSD